MDPSFTTINEMKPICVPMNGTEPYEHVSISTIRYTEVDFVALSINQRVVIIILLGRSVVDLQIWHFVHLFSCW